MFINSPESILKVHKNAISTLLLKNQEFLPPSTNWTNFAQTNPPRFQYGEILRWISADEETDWGIVIGRFYNYEPHQRCWMWCYLIWLDPNSKSASWCRFDTAWEEDLERFDND